MSYSVVLLPALSPEYAACERTLVDAGVRMALPHRASWALARRKVDSHRVVLSASGGGGACVGAFGVDIGASRALPGYRLWRVERFGPGLPRRAWPAAVQALADLARKDGRVLRVNVEVFARDAEERIAMGELLAAAGFTPAPEARNWSTTLTIDLQRSEQELLASFSQLARRGIRSVDKLPVQVRPIEDPQYADRMEDLRRETLGRTGGDYEALFNWPGVMELSRRVPDASRLVGLFRTDRTGPDALLGFYWGWSNGDSVSYFSGASARPDDLKQVKIGHPLMWDLIRWAKQNGATWFDLGGVTDMTTVTEDPVAGITAFKHLFSKQRAEIAADWVLEPRPIPARLATLVHTGVAWVSRVAGLW